MEASATAAAEWRLILILGVVTVVLAVALLATLWLKTPRSSVTAILAHGLCHPVEFRYRPAKGGVTTLRASIYEIHQRRGRLYFHGVCPPGRRFRSFRSDRVESLVDLKSGETAQDIDGWLRRLAGRA